LHLQSFDKNVASRKEDDEVASEVMIRNGYCFLGEKITIFSYYCLIIDYFTTPY